MKSHKPRRNPVPSLKSARQPVIAALEPGKQHDEPTVSRKELSLISFFLGIFSLVLLFSFGKFLFSSHPDSDVSFYDFINRSPTWLTILFVLSQFSFFGFYIFLFLWEPNFFRLKRYNKGDFEIIVSRKNFLKNNFEVRILLKGALLKNVLFDNILPNSPFDLRNDDQIIFTPNSDSLNQFFVVLPNSVQLFIWNGKGFSILEHDK